MSSTRSNPCSPHGSCLVERVLPLPRTDTVLERTRMRVTPLTKPLPTPLVTNPGRTSPARLVAKKNKSDRPGPYAQTLSLPLPPKASPRPTDCALFSDAPLPLRVNLGPKQAHTQAQVWSQAQPQPHVQTSSALDSTSLFASAESARAQPKHKSIKVVSRRYRPGKENIDPRLSRPVLLGENERPNVNFQDRSTSEMRPSLSPSVPTASIPSSLQQQNSSPERHSRWAA